MTGLRGRKLVILIVVVIASSSLAFLVQNDYQMQVLFRIALFAALGLGWNIVGGYAGQLSLGHVAFFGIGAYSLALLTKYSVPLWLSVVLGAIIATAFAAPRNL